MYNRKNKGIALWLGVYSHPAGTCPLFDSWSSPLFLGTRSRVGVETLNSYISGKRKPTQMRREAHEMDTPWIDLSQQCDMQGCQLSNL